MGQESSINFLLSAEKVGGDNFKEGVWFRLASPNTPVIFGTINYYYNNYYNSS